ncbi:MAG: hypothetical protein KY434_08665, partial [Actinobacteria bacterium]|nr:hypothetical protein [Actinomycetota bacterium]
RCRACQAWTWVRPGHEKRCPHRDEAPDDLGLIGEARTQPQEAESPPAEPADARTDGGPEPEADRAATPGA